MTDAPWTAGPWEVYDSWSVRGGPEGGVHIAEPAHRSEANARLIAAAPEMVKVLESLDRWGVASTETVEDARALLARIRGES